MSEIVPPPSLDVVPVGETAYKAYVETTLVSHCCSTSDNLAMKYLFPKANISAAVNDHDYLEKPYTEYWIDDSLEVRILRKSAIANSKLLTFHLDFEQ